MVLDQPAKGAQIIFFLKLDYARKNKKDRKMTINQLNVLEILFLNIRFAMALKVNFRFDIQRIVDKTRLHYYILEFNGQSAK